MNISLNEEVEFLEIKKGDVIFKEGDLPDTLYIVEEGLVRCLKWYDKRLVPILTIGEAELLGEDCVLSDTNTYFYSAVAIEDCRLIVINKVDVYNYLESQSPWVKNILSNMSEKIQHTADLLVEHKISDNSLLKNKPLTEEEEALLRSKL